MSHYIFEKTFERLIFEETELNLTDFEDCLFSHCNFAKCHFVGVVFINCRFESCVFKGANINHVSLRDVFFWECNLKNINFAMSDKFIFAVQFEKSNLDFAKFYGLKMKATQFLNCSLIAVDFMATDLTLVDFDNCDLYRAEFELAIANKTNFKTSYNYTINPSKTKLKKAVFSRNEVKGLLYAHEIEVF